jgi:hypothetical protein
VNRLNRAYAEKNNLLICKCCGSFEKNWGGESEQDCESCGNWVDAEKTLTSEELEKQIATALTNCKEIEDGDGEHVWLCNERMPTHETKKNHSYVFVRVQYADYWCGRDADVRYWGEICIVNIGMAGKNAVLMLKEECGCPDMPSEAIARELMNTGICATVVQVQGNSKIEVLQELNKQLTAVNTLGGFYLDRQMNAIGATGWDFMKGDPMAGLKRYQAANK